MKLAAVSATRREPAREDDRDDHGHTKATVRREDLCASPVAWVTVTWLADHWLDLLGWAGSALLIVSLLQARVLRFRVLNLPPG